MRRLALASFVLAACRTPAPAAQQTDAAADDGSEPPVSKAAVRELDDMRVTVTDATSEALPLPRATALALPGEFVAQIAEPPRWVVANGKKMSVVSRATNRVLGSIDGAYRDDVDRGHARVDGWHGPDKALALLSLVDGRVHIPRARLADGTSLKVERIVSNVGVAPVYVLALDAAEKRYLGVWNVDAGDDVLLSQPAPAAGNAVMQDSRSKKLVLFAPSGSGTLKGDECAGAFFDEKESSCFLHGRDYDGRPLYVLHDGVVARGAMLMDMGRHRESVSTLGDSATLAAALEAPPRALLAINEGVTEAGGSIRRKLEILGPGGSAGTFPLDVKSDANTFSSVRCDAAHPIVAEQAFSGVSASMVFVDLGRDRVVRLPFTVDTLARKTLPRRFVAVERGTTNDSLVLVDLATPKVTRLRTLPKCPGPYSASTESDAFASLV